MRTKTLLIAASALAATVVTSQAQVYSANIVGYANVVLVGGYNLVANPFDDGNGNQLTNVINASILPAKSSVTTWNSVGQNFNSAITGGGGVWNGNTTLQPGAGFFIKNGTAASPTVTNTFVGTVVVPVGGSGTNQLLNNYTLVGSEIPYASANLFTDTNVNLVNSGLAGKSSVTTWNAVGQNYNSVATFGTAPATPLAVGQGFFIKSVQGPTNWVQTLPAQ
jgi:hypothetical protein